MKGEAIQKAVLAVTARWAKQRKGEERDASRRSRRRDAMTRSRRMTIKEAAELVLPEAYLKASSDGTLPAHARQIMYAARGRIQEFTGRTLNDQYFTQTLLPDYTRDNPEETADWDVVFDARGHFEEPHTQKMVPLGTIDVRRYIHRIAADRSDTGVAISLDNARYPARGPGDRYSTVLFIEKEGFLPLFRKVRLAERYDLAIMSTKGQSVTASRRLIDEICGAHNILLLVLHDFDKAGFSILGTLQRDTRRYCFANSFDVIDLGLRLDDVERWELEAEDVHYGNSNPSGNLEKNGATKREIAFLVAHRGYACYSGRRVELNAFASGDFVKWIEEKLKKHGIAKVVPNRQTLETAFRRKVEEQYLSRTIKRARATARRAAKNAAVPKDLEERIRELLAANPESAWDDVVGDLAEQGR